MSKWHPDNFTIEVAGASHTGRARETNDDSFLTVRLPGASDAILAVADGVGGRDAGDIASRMAVKMVLDARLRLSTPCLDCDVCMARLRAAVQQANGFLFKLNRQFGNPNFATGTTLTTLHVMPGHGVLFNVGDSRCYRLRKNRLEVLTRDDSWAQRLIDERKMLPAEVARHPLANTLCKCMGSSPAMHSGFGKVGCKWGDRFLLATDGIWKVLKTDQIKLALSDSTRAKEAVDRLVLASLRGGGRDNLAACVAFLT